MNIGAWVVGTSGTSWYILYLDVIGACLKVTIAIFCFCHSKNHSHIMGNIFNSISTYSSKKNLFVNKYEKQICYKETKSLFFDVINGQFFSSKVFHFQYDNRFLFSKETRNIRMRKQVRLQNLLNLDCQDRICFVIFQAAYNEESLFS